MTRRIGTVFRQRTLSRASLRHLRQPTSALLALALVIAVGHFLWLILTYTNLFVHPDWHRYILPESLRYGLALTPEDIVGALQPRMQGEFRPRFLAYLIQAIDQKTRLYLYQWGPVHPTLAPVAWLLQLVVAPWCLYRLLVNLTADRGAALASVAVFITANGFLSGFTMGLLQGKTFSNVVLLAALWAASEAFKRLRPGQVLVDAPGPAKYLMLLALLLGLFVDEMPVAAFMILPLIFFTAFIPIERGVGGIGAIVRNGLFFSIPVAVFLVFVLSIVPPITEAAFNCRFDYLGNTLLIGKNTYGATSLLEGPTATWTPTVMLDNFTTLFGISLAPYFISPFRMAQHFPYPDGQVTNVPKIVILVAFFGVAGFVAWRTRGPFANHLRGLLVAVPAFFLFLSLLQVRHLPVSTGYYYGAIFAGLLAVLVGMMFKGVSLVWPAGRPVMALVVLGIVAVQLVNFQPINQGWQITHNELVTRPGFANTVTWNDQSTLTRHELQAIWRAWRDGDLDGYLARFGVSTSAFYEVQELRALDWKPPDFNRCG